MLYVHHSMGGLIHVFIFFPNSKNTQYHAITHTHHINSYHAYHSGLPSISRTSSRKLARPRWYELQCLRGVLLPTSFGLLSSCCVQFSLLISSSASTNDFCAARSASPYHLPTTSLHRITYTLFSSPSQRRRVQNQSAKRPGTVWLKNGPSNLYNSVPWQFHTPLQSCGFTSSWETAADTSSKLDYISP